VFGDDVDRLVEVLVGDGCPVCDGEDPGGLVADSGGEGVSVLAGGGSV
jgi:hypothetical protein